MSALISDLYFNPNTCHVCKIYDPDIKNCTGCYLISYCGKEHQKEHWNTHKELCTAMQKINKEIGYHYYDKYNNELKTQVITTKIEKNRKHENTNQDNEDINDLNINSANENQIEELTNNIQNIEVVTNQENFKWNQYKFRLLMLAEIFLKRNILNIEKEIILNPKVCFDCKCNKTLSTCDNCFTVNYCNKHSINSNHSCKELKLIYNIHKYLINKYSNDFSKYILMICDYNIEHKITNIYEHLILNEYTSYFRTFKYLLDKCNINKENITIHIVGAGEYECSFYNIYLWENIFHLFKEKNNKIKAIKLVFVGLYNIENELSLDKSFPLCKTCKTNNNELYGEYFCMTYDEYIDKLIDANYNVTTTLTNVNEPTLANGNETTLTNGNETVLTNGNKAALKNNIVDNQFFQRFQNSFYIRDNKNDYNFDKNKKIEVDLIIAYNAGFHEFDFNKDQNTWHKTLLYFLKYINIPIAFTSYTFEEIKKDTNLIKKLGKDLKFDFMLDCDINNECSLKPRLDPENATSVYYFNKYVSCFKVH